MCIDVPLAPAIEARYGQKANIAPGRGDFKSAFDCIKIKRFFGWKAQYSWRNK